MLDLPKWTWVWALFVIFHTQSIGQRDTLFWFVAPHITPGHSSGPMMLRIASFSDAARIVIDQPANTSFVPIEINLPANGTQSVNLTAHSSTILNYPPAQILTYGIRIRSTADIFVYYEVNRPDNPDIFSLKGQNALGNRFFVPIQNTYNSGNYNPPARAGFDIVATEDNTVVSITPKHDAVGHPAGISFDITLNAGQTYSLEAVSPLSSLKLSGSLIESSKPIAVTMKDDSSRGPAGTCSDLGGDQLVPTHVLGTEYVVVRGFLNLHDHVYILATEDDTDIFINGNFTSTIQQGDLYAMLLPADAMHIRTDHPVYVSHLSGYGCETGAAILPKLNCTGSLEVSFVRSSNNGFFLNVCTAAGNETAFSLNGNTSIVHAGLFQDVPGTNGGYKFARIQLNTSQVPLGVFSTLKNSTGVFSMGIVNGSPDGGTRYGYFSDFATFRVRAGSSSKRLCEGDSVQLIAEFFPNATYQWTGPGQFTSKDREVKLQASSINQSGWYSVTAEVPGCPSSTDSVFIEIQQRPMALDYGYPGPVCEGFPIDLFVDVEPGISISWNGPNGFESDTSHISIDQDSTEAKGIYTFVLSNGICLSDTFSILVDVNPSYSTSFTVEACDKYIWPADGNEYRESGLYMLKLLSDAGCDSILMLQLEINKSTELVDEHRACDSFTWPVNGKTYTATGLYRETFQGQNGCDSVWMLDLTIDKSQLIEEVIRACEEFEWSVNGRTYTESGVFLESFVDQGGCDSIRRLVLEIQPSYLVETVADTCGSYTWPVNGVTYFSSGFYKKELQSAGGCDSILTLDLTIFSIDTIYESIDTVYYYNWPVDNRTFFESGIYEAVFKSASGCDSVHILNLRLREEKGVFVPNVFTPNGDGINDRFTLFGTEFAKRVLSLIIYDRWGEKIAEYEDFPLNDTSFGWDGLFRGEPMNPGVFVYTAEVLLLSGERLVLKGDVLLYR